MSFFAASAIVFATAVCVSLAGVEISIRLARRINALDRPGRRSSHETPTPRLGGLGIAAGILAGWSTALFLWRDAEFMNPRAIGLLIVMGGAGLIALGFGLIDDLKTLSPSMKFYFQAFCAIIPILMGIGAQHIRLPGIGRIDLGWAWTILTALWIVFFMNAYNFMDGMDGHNAVFGVLAAMTMAAAIWMGLDRIGAWEWRLATSVVIAGALLGFLPHNLTSPARTFMGDGGSQMIGFMLALGAAAAASAAILPAFLALWPFVFDVIYTLIVRARRRENLTRAHRDHLYQRLLRAGLTHRQSLAHSLAFQIACVAGALAALWGAKRGAPDAGAWIGLCVAIAATLIYVARVWRIERRHAIAAGEAV